MQLNSTEIAELIKQRIAQFDVKSEARNEGTIVSVSDGIIRIHGLADAMQGEMIELPGNRFALALNLERDSVGAVVGNFNTGVAYSTGILPLMIETCSRCNRNIEQQIFGLFVIPVECDTKMTA